MEKEVPFKKILKHNDLFFYQTHCLLPWIKNKEDQGSKILNFSFHYKP